MDNILEIAILEMCRQKGEKSFSCDEVIQWMYPQDWEKFTKDIHLAAQGLKQKGKIMLSESWEINEVKN
ncbi:hypothetical protein IFO69_10980 [Echinicola sp. CAU 1574]|uniref:DUF3253 domain-containing protein n=1 Tax=Echinicola arenosa TaxID=2774144 RepID=A0ABR9AKD0_9BACT|nr:hypothetical protein [Echinicola arenosa]MBD8489269.1 hypothetical protein [Echinicola arenosa]